MVDHDADPDFGRFQARQLTTALRAKFENTGVSVVHSLAKGLVEVRLAGVNKGEAVDSLFMETSAVAPVDFVLCIGADDADEFMLSAM
jgi:trehalose-6-phosphatase